MLRTCTGGCSMTANTWAAHQIRGVLDPQVGHEAVLRQRSLENDLDSGWIAFLNLEIYVGLILCQLWRFRDKLEEQDQQH